MTSAADAPPFDTDTPEVGIDAEALGAIRSMVAAQPAAAARNPSTHTSPEREQRPEVTAPPRRRKSDVLPPLAAPLADPEPQSSDVRPRTARRFAFSRLTRTPLMSAEPLMRLRGYRPTRVHVALALITGLVLLRPWLVVSVAFSALFVLTALFLILGYDGFWMRAMKIGRWYADRSPARAKVLHRRLDRFAMRWDTFLDRFPEGTVDGLYLPDFGDLATADSRHDEVVKHRLAGLREKDA